MSDKYQVVQAHDHTLIREVPAGTGETLEANARSSMSGSSPTSTAPSPTSRTTEVGLSNSVFSDHYGGKAMCCRAE
jgi:hypothetical protein